MPTDLKPAHDALESLVKELKTKDLTHLRATGPTRFKDGVAWLDGLEEALREVRSWCKGFSIDAEPKR